ncbi:hypothetical protein CAPTEDRAFT_223995 [Capitella teleta]|uniref:Uncharacterized protein n=1 Tax=Capitella teleta TaxID=283909 RepID=R7TQ82_CAPTE|nr:hypothetical protein CAPTEDRAFT_223995 [Capitella teleta]|eukprot:ELT93195.1 hypothetical protein CAPTEDRAFT_223995 [Capitella teleta]
MNSLWICAAVAVVGLVSCQDRAMVGNNPKPEGDDGVQIVVNYLTGQQNDYSKLMDRVRSLEADVNRLKSSNPGNVNSGGGSATNGVDCGCPRGPPGPVGPSGPRGPSGPAGRPGIYGRTGATGLHGQTGVDGATGATGRMGYAGSRGDTGATGATGQMGQDGRTGATGVPVKALRCESSERISNIEQQTEHTNKETVKNCMDTTVKETVLYEVASAFATAPPTPPPAPGPLDQEIRSVLREHEVQKSRKLNLIIYRLNHNEVHSQEERLAKDAKASKAMCQAINLKGISLVKLMRLGPYHIGSRTIPAPSKSPSMTLPRFCIY